MVVVHTTRSGCDNTLDYSAIQEAKEMRERGEEKAAAVEAETREVKTIEITGIKEYPPCCDVITVK